MPLMPHTIEHQIRVLDRPCTPPYCSPPPPPADELRRDHSWVESPLEQSSMAERPPTIRSHAADPDQSSQKVKRSFEGGEEIYGVESFERNLRYSPHEVERQHFSVRTFGDSSSLTNGRESRTSVKFDDQATPDDNSQWNQHGSSAEENLLHRTHHLDTIPLKIPRAQIGQKDGTRHRGPEIPFRWRPADHRNHHYSPSMANVPMKKVIRKSRLVSIHDGRPMEKVVETVHYEPVMGGGRASSLGSTRRTTNILDGSFRCKSPELWTSSSSCSLSSDEDRGEVRRRMGGRGEEVELVRGRERSVRMGTMVEQNPLWGRR